MRRHDPEAAAVIAARNEVSLSHLVDQRDASHLVEQREVDESFGDRRDARHTNGAAGARTRDKGATRIGPVDAVYGDHWHVMPLLHHPPCPNLRLA